jgi:hypothetical protein
MISAVLDGERLALALAIYCEKLALAERAIGFRNYFRG